MTEREAVQRIRKRYKAQYYRKRTGWCTYNNWSVQPEEAHLIMGELKSLDAVEALLNDSWTRYYRRMKKFKRGEG